MGERLKAKNLRLTLDEKANDFLIEKGYDPIYGARPMRRAVEQYLEDPLAEEVLKGKLAPNSIVRVTLENDKLVFTPHAIETGAVSSAEGAAKS